MINFCCFIDLLNFVDITNLQLQGKSELRKNCDLGEKIADTVFIGTLKIFQSIS